MESCKDGACITIVYADSLSPVSADEYGSPITPITSRCSAAGIARLARASRDMLLTPHPSASVHDFPRCRIVRKRDKLPRLCQRGREAAGRAIAAKPPPGTSWKLTAYAPKPVIHAALLAHDGYGTGIDLVISGSGGRGGSA